MARAALNAREYDQAAAYAKQTSALVQDQLKRRPLDAEPHLPLALGAAIEVPPQTLAARGQRAQVIAVLQTALRTDGGTSIRARPQKNLNLLSFEGKLAPALRGEQFLGSKPPGLAQLKGSPAPLFFWVDWCSCYRKAEAPIITQLRTEFASKGLTVLGPTLSPRLYGASGERGAQRRTRRYRCRAPPLLRRVAGNAGSHQHVQLRGGWGLDHAYACAARPRGNCDLRWTILGRRPMTS